MHSTQKHQAATGELLGHGHVGRQHELLDHLVTLVVNRLADPLDSTLPIQLDPNLRQVQLQGTQLEATPAEHSAELVQFDQQSANRQRHLAVESLGIRQQLADLLVTEPPRDPDRRLGEFDPTHDPLVAVLDQRREHITEPVLLQAGQAV